MIWKAEDFRGLSDVQATEMRELQLSRADYDAMRRRIAHGDLCSALIHLRSAQDFFKDHTPGLAAKLGNIAASIDEEVPSYGSMSFKKRGGRE